MKNDQLPVRRMRPNDSRILRRLDLTPVLVAAACFLAATQAWAHGVDYRIEQGAAVQVWFSAHGGSVLADAGYRVFAPDSDAVDMPIYARGRTDALGRAVFVPDQAGQWRLVLATEDGHGADVTIPVTLEQLSGRTSAPSVQVGNSGRLAATLSGIGYVLGLAGIWMLWRSRGER